MFEFFREDSDVSESRSDLGDGRGRVAGKAALVTGAASGLGFAAAEMLAREGARVAVTDVNPEGARRAAERIGRDAIALPLDVTSEDQWITALDACVKTFGGLQVLVNNAGIALQGTVEETSLADWRRLHAIDLDGVFLGCKYAIPRIAASGGGSIINISSISGIIAGHNLAAYNSAKAAVRHLTKSVALHCARQDYNIRCNSVHPTFIDTPLLGDLAPGKPIDEIRGKLAKQIPLKRIGKPEDVGYAVIYLASDESAFMTGSELVLDGGISAM